MDLYIANTSKQRHVFTYRALETGKERQYPIDPGAQRVVVKNGSSEQVDAVIQRYEPYGLVDATTLDQTPHFVGLVYSVDKPITARNIEKGLRDNDDVLTRESHERRQVSAAALDQQLHEQGIGYAGNIELSAEQQVNALDPNDEAKIKETIKADRTAEKPRKTNKKK